MNESLNTGEPKWRDVLCWGVVVTFLTLPLGLLILAILSHFFVWNLTEQVRDFKFIGNYFQSVTALAFGLAGLNSADKFLIHKNGNLPKPTHNPK